MTYSIQLKRKRLESQLESLGERYLALSDQFNYEQNAAKKITIRKELEDLEKEMKGVEEEINSLGPSPERRHLYLKEHLPKIDFKKTREVFASARAALTNSDAVLLLMHNSQVLKGNLFIGEIKQDLKAYSEGKIKHCPLAFFAFELERIFFLDRFAKSLDSNHFATAWKADSDSDKAKNPIDFRVERLIEFIVTHLRNHDLNSEWVLFVEIGILGSTKQLSLDFFHWFMLDFWRPLLQKAQSQTKSGCLKILFLIEFKLEWQNKENLDKEYGCNPSEIHREKILELPLHNWKEEDILDWLCRYSGLQDRSQIIQHAKSIFEQNNEGIPLHAFEALQNNLKYYEQEEI